MAKKSMVNRDTKRSKIALKYKEKRLELKKIINPTKNQEQKL